METRIEKKMTIKFGIEEKKLITRIANERLGHVTVSYIIDSSTMCFVYYKALISMLDKVWNWDNVYLTPDEYNVLGDLLSKAYNSDSETEKELIKQIGDAIDAQKNCY